jgi:hypothetical protein
MSFTPQDHWLIARVVMGYPMPDYPPGITVEGEMLALRLLALDFKDREWVLRRESPQHVVKAVLAVDADSAAPRSMADARPYQIVAADDLHKLPPLTWIIQGEIVERGMCVLFGESGVGKSFVALDYAMRIAAAGQPVLYAPTEGEGGYRKRVEAWKAFHKIHALPSLFFIFGGISLHDEKLMTTLLPELKRLSPKLMVIDTLAMGMVGLDENSARDVGLFMASCRRVMRELETALLLVHHTSKAGVIERGSTALRGNADTMIRLSNADDLVLMECSKTKDEAPFEPRYLRMITFGNSLVPLPADKTILDDSLLTSNQRKLLDLLSLEINRDGLSLRDASEASGISLGSAQRALSNLLKKHLAEKNGGFRITEKGLRSIGIESPDSKPELSAIQQSAAPDPLESAESPDSEKRKAIQNGSSDSPDSPDSVGSPDSPALPGFDKVMSRRVNQYERGA